MKTSRLEGFYKKTLEERLGILREQEELGEADVRLLKTGGLALEVAERMVENCIGMFSLPLGVATNFKVNGKEVLVPMALEEPSVIAAASHAAKLCLPEGFHAESDEPVMRGQIQLVGIRETEAARKKVQESKDELLNLANSKDSVLVKLGGGAKKVEARVLQGARGKMLLVELFVDVRDAMGANAVNTMCESIAGKLEEITGGKRRARILSNLCTERKVRASAVWKKETLGEETIEAILDAYDLAVHDMYRATTHNKGIMNGIDAVMVAAGNDWRAVEAGAHAYTSLQGRYLPLTKWEKRKNGDLLGSIELPMAVGIVGGATRSHPLAKLSLKIMGVQHANELAEIAACVGVANNLAAMRALATEGIQKGHLRLHARNYAIAAGASGEQADAIASRMIEENNVSHSRALELFQQLKKKK